MALGTPEIRQQVEALAIGQSIEFKFNNGGSRVAPSRSASTFRPRCSLALTRGSNDG
jgi:hypothetical protein